MKSMKGWRGLVILMVILLALGGCGESTPSEQTAGRDPQEPASLAVPANGIYLGAYIDFGAMEDEVTLEAIEDFENMVGRHQAVVASSSYWGQQSFPRRNVELIANHGSVPLIYWSPWDQPYEENKPPDRFRLENILAGRWDEYIDRWADGARDFGRPLLVSWGLEMNGNWFPWSGLDYGAGKPAVKGKTQGFAGPERYKKAYRYVVDRVRARGAVKIQWVFHVNNNSWPPAPWNTIAQYYPGPDYVDWLGMSAYGKQFPAETWFSFAEVADRCYQELCRLDPNKPVMVAEWGVGEFPAAGSKAQWLKEALELIKTRYTRVRAAVYWHERWQNEDETYSNLRINSSPEAVAAFREALADPVWFGNVIAAKTGQ